MHFILIYLKNEHYSACAGATILIMKNSLKEVELWIIEDNADYAETEILRSNSNGIPRRHISDSLNIGIHAVDFHIRSVFKKFDVHSQPAAVAIAIKNNII